MRNNEHSIAFLLFAWSRGFHDVACRNGNQFGFRPITRVIETHLPLSRRQSDLYSFRGTRNLSFGFQSTIDWRTGPAIHLLTK